MFDYIGRSFIMLNVMNLLWALPILVYLLCYTECGTYLKKTRERHELLRQHLIEKKKEEIRKEKREAKEKERKEKDVKEKERYAEELCEKLSPLSSSPSPPVHLPPPEQEVANEILFS